MMVGQGGRGSPLSRVALIFGMFSMPLAFARHLVSLALVLAVLAIVLGSWGRWKDQRSVGEHGQRGAHRALWAVRAGSVGLLCAVLMWYLWASNVLLE